MDGYDLELPRIAKEIKKNRARKVCVQLPDGLKPKATEIVRELKSKTKAEISIWAGSNFGGCDLPLYLKDLGFDLLINLGHVRFRR